MPNVWKWKAKDKDGKDVEGAPGAPYFISRGPSSVKDMKAAAELYLMNKRRAAVYADLPDPGYGLVPDSIEPVGSEDEAMIGGWRPQGAVPVQTPTDPKPDTDDGN